MAKKTVEKKTEENAHDSKKNIHQRINAVMNEVNFILKGKEIKNAKGEVMYTVATHDHVTKIIHPKLVQHGINILPECVGMVQEGQNRVRVDMEFTWVNIDDPADCFVKKWSAFGMDSQHDKAIGKAYSYAQRLMTLKTLHIQSGDEDDVPIEDCEDGQEEFKPASVASVAIQAANDGIADSQKNGTANEVKAAFLRHCKQEGLDETKVVTVLKEMGYASYGEIPTERVPHLKAKITEVANAGAMS